ncbi:hypothetical protein CPB84DRAFT_292048 [Gymnopilus junonius]|uniref:Uncharacterized protein n=1 Tax=Gymnopilus junonius TaxID=109634 RepID=A0A9P5NEU1_GYMJU|nr:hypothetical protein CPB84DRAFT_292048 [Gymnopilus junonius]
MLSVEEIERYTQSARDYEETQRSIDENDTLFPTITTTTNSSPGFACDVASSTTSITSDPHAISLAEAQSYYAGLHSEPILLYRTGKEQWSPPRGPEAQRRLKELREVFNHPIAKVWNDDVGWKVVAIMDTHTIRFTSIDVVRFKKVEVDEPDSDEEDVEDEEEDEKQTPKAKKQNIGPVTIWIGVFPESTTPTAAHDAAQDVLALLKDYEITDVDVDFRESLYIREAGPQLLPPVEDLDPLVDVIGPLTPALGLRISTRAKPNAQGTMALYLAEGGDSDTLLGLSCRHVLIGSKEGNFDYIRHPRAPSKDVLLLGKRAYTDLVYSIKVRIRGYGISMECWTEQIEMFSEREKGTDQADIQKAAAFRIETQALLDKAKTAIEALTALLKQVDTDWKKLNDRVLGHVLRSPGITLGAGDEHFTEDWAIFQIDRAKLGDGFQGNKLDLGKELTPDEFPFNCFPHGTTNWEFKYPIDHLLPLTGPLPPSLMHAPDTLDSADSPCLLVVKNGTATGTTLGRANGPFSIVRDYFNDMSIHQTSMEWAILNYASKSEAFSGPGDSGSVVADIRGRIGGMVTGGCGGRTEGSDVTYATPFWWLLRRIRKNGFPNAHLDVRP